MSAPGWESRGVCLCARYVVSCLCVCARYVSEVRVCVYACARGACVCVFMCMLCQYPSPLQDGKAERCVGVYVCWFSLDGYGFRQGQGARTAKLRAVCVSVLCSLFLSPFLPLSPPAPALPCKYVCKYRMHFHARAHAHARPPILSHSPRVQSKSLAYSKA